MFSLRPLRTCLGWLKRSLEYVFVFGFIRNPHSIIIIVKDLFTFRSKENKKGKPLGEERCSS